MFKIRLRRNKDTIIGAAVTLTVVVLILINVVVLVPQIIDAYRSEKPINGSSPIDAESVNAAIDFLSTTN